MKIDSIIIVIGILIATFFFYRGRNQKSIVVTSLLMVAYLLTLIPQAVVLGVSLVLLGLALLMGLFYSFWERNLETRKRTVLFVFIIPVFLVYLFSIFHWQGFELLRYGQLISVGAFMYMLFNHKDYKNEMSFIILILAYSLTKLF